MNSAWNIDKALARAVGQVCEGGTCTYNGYCSSVAERCRRYERRPVFQKPKTRILEQYWKLGTCSVREISTVCPRKSALLTQPYRRSSIDLSRKALCAK